MTAVDTVCTLWDDLARELEALYGLSSSIPTNQGPALTEQMSRVEGASASLRAALTGLDRRSRVTASLYDQVEALLTLSLRPGSGPNVTPLTSASVKDLASRVSYASRYPAMVQHTMLCDSIDDHDWPHSTPVHTDQALVAAQLSLAAAVAQHRGKSAQAWVGHTLTEQDAASIRAVAAAHPILEQDPEWFGRTLPERRRAFAISGVLDELDATSTEIALGLLDGWESSVGELLDAAQRLTD